MKRNVFIIPILLLPTFLLAQDIHLLNNLQNPMQFNPAATGLIYSNRIAISGETILGFDNPPITTQINYEKSIDSTAWGFGVLALYDHIGFYDEEHLEGHVRYSIINKSNTKLSVGGALIYASFHLNPNWYIPESSIENDPAIPDEFRIYAARCAFGSWFKNRWLDAGVSFYGTIHQFNQTPAGFPFYNRYTAYASAKIINRSNFQLRPDVSLLFDGLNNNYLLFYGINTTFKEKYRAGIKMRNNKDLVPSIGYDFRNFSIDVVVRIPSNFSFGYLSAIQLAYRFN